MATINKVTERKMNGVCSVAACCGYLTAIERSEVLVFFVFVSAKSSNGKSIPLLCTQDM